MPGFDWGAFGGDLLGSVLGFVGGMAGRDQANSQYLSQLGFSNQNFNYQRYLAENGIQLRVRDAKAAGISPLAALGIPSFGGGIVSGPQSFDVGNPMAALSSGVSRMGQDISRSTSMQMTAEEKMERDARIALLGAQMNEMQSRTDLNKATMASVYARMPGANVPSLPSEGGNVIAGQGNSTVVPAKVTSSQVGNAAVTAGPPSTETTWISNADGTILTPQPTRPEVTNSTSIFNPEYWGWLSRNKFHGGMPPDPQLLPYGYSDWVFRNGNWHAVRPMEKPRTAW